jgi:hypothetical protein
VGAAAFRLKAGRFEPGRLDDAQQAQGHFTSASTIETGRRGFRFQVEPFKLSKRRYGHLFYCVLNSIIRTFFGSWSLTEPVGTGSGTALRRLVVRRGRCRAPRCCLPRDTPPGSAHTPQEPFSHALLGQRARRRLHSGALAQAAGAEVSLRTPGLSHVVASPPALVCGHPSP